MAYAERSLLKASDDWNRLILGEASAISSKPFDAAMNKLDAKFRELGKSAKNETVDVIVPLQYPSSTDASSLHGKTTRLEVDMEVSSDIRYYYMRYSRGITDAISSVRSSADAQSWGIERFDRMVGAIYKDNLEHAKDIKYKCDEYAKKFEKDDTYEKLLTSAAKLRGEMRIATRNISLHFRKIADEEMLKEIRREDKQPPPHWY
jgi:hypothetical protein